MKKPIKRNDYLKRTVLNKLNKQLLDTWKEEGNQISDFSDEYHTFNELYEQRLILSAMVFNQFKDKAWKSKKHDDGTMFEGGYFIVGISSPKGDYSYHYKLKDWDLFKVKELESGLPYDGHTAKDIRRLLSLI